MKDAFLEQLLEREIAAGRLIIGEILIAPVVNGGFELSHRDDARGSRVPPGVALAPEHALAIAKVDDEGKYRPLRTAPNLRHGWKIVVADISAAIDVIGEIYPGRLAAWRAWKAGRLTTTPLRETLNRQSGMYRVAARISEDQIEELVGNFCRSDGGCLRTILWTRDRSAEIASAKLALEKFDPAFDQTGRGGKCIPLLCPEGCHLLVAECRKVVKNER